MSKHTGETTLTAFEQRLFDALDGGLTPSAEAWRDWAECRDVPDPEIFFDLSPTSAATTEALTYCRRCPVVQDCLQSAVLFGDWGVRGGVYRPAPDSRLFGEQRKAAS